MICKDCIHGDVCRYKELPVIAEQCVDFKDKSKYIELPCKVGDVVYHIIREVAVTEESVYQVRIYEDTHIAFSAKRKGGRIVFNEDDIGKTIFLTREEAEQKLKEFKDNE